MEPGLAKCEPCTLLQSHRRPSGLQCCGRKPELSESKMTSSYLASVRSAMVDLQCQVQRTLELKSIKVQENCIVCDKSGLKWGSVRRGPRPPETRMQDQAREFCKGDHDLAMTAVVRPSPWFPCSEASPRTKWELRCSMCWSYIREKPSDAGWYGTTQNVQCIWHIKEIICWLFKTFCLFWINFSRLLIWSELFLMF